MTFEEYKAKTEDMVNEINDLCATAVVTDQMSLDEVIAYYEDRLKRIYTVCSYPDSHQPSLPNPIERGDSFNSESGACLPNGRPDDGLPTTTLASKREMRTIRRPLECEPYGPWERYPMPNSPEYIYGKPGELFEQLRETADGKDIEHSIVRVVDGKDIVIWRAAYQV
jgi:hypothetical protein